MIPPLKKNGIDTSDDYIFVKKKIVGNDNSKGINGNNIQVPIIKGNIINLMFVATTGLKVAILVGLKNTFRDAAIAFCNKININPSIIDKDIIFLRSGSKLDLNDNKTLEQMKIKGNERITVWDNKYIIGA